MIIDVDFVEGGSFNADFGEVYEVAGEDRYAEGYTDGQVAQEQAFWDMFQHNGKRTDYEGAFRVWSSETITPKYPITTGTLYQMIRNCYYIKSFPWDKIVSTREDGTFTSINSMCYYTRSIESVDMDFVFTSTAANSAVNEAFRSCEKLVRIQKIVSNEIFTYTNTFVSCASLTDITFEGVIGRSISFNWSPLSVDSMKSVITHLANYSGTNSEFTYTVKFTDACWAALDAEGNTAPHGGTWRDYVNTLCWNI